MLNKLKRSVYILLAFMLVAINIMFSTNDVTGQSAQPTKAQKKVEQKKEERKKNQLKAEKKGREQHMKIQDKDTRKRMKKHRKQTKHPYGKKPNFFQRIFN